MQRTTNWKFPEMILMDSNLNKNLHVAVKKNVLLYTSLLDDNDDENNFLNNTLQQSVHAYWKLWDPSLCPDRVTTSRIIVKNFDCIVDKVLLKIPCAGGPVVRVLRIFCGYRDLGIVLPCRRKQEAK